VAAAPSHGEMVKTGFAGVFDAAWKALLSDLNVPEALGCVFSVVNKTKVDDLSATDAKSLWLNLHFVLDAIGIILPEIKEDEAVAVPDDIRLLAEQRWNAKQSKDWAAADELRKKLELAGWIIKDRKDGFDVVPK
jgi:cysteinyl-tRNA synthetase